MSEQSSSVRSIYGGARTSGATAELDGTPVLSQIHVSCYVTAANRATPVFEVTPNCVRVVNKSVSKSSSGTPVGGVTSTGMMSTASSSGAEWNFHTVFSSTSPSHSIDFFTEITLPALRSARDGINTNVVVWGVHPTQKFRLLFGKSVGGGGFAPQPEMAVNDVVELYGQLIGMLHAFFSQLDMGSRLLQQQDAKPWRLGISSWIIVNNQAIDLLKTPITGTSIDYGRMPSSAGQAEPLSFVSLEAPSLATAFRIVQTAKTNRIVRKQNEESVHFFVRLALFHDGQVSTVHLVDLVDQKGFQDDVLIQEKLEFYNILQDLRQHASSPKQSSRRSSVPGPMSSQGKMVLSNFMLPLLTANAKTFLYANVIDSRASLRESVQMLNAVANLRGFACVCKPLRDISFEQLGFQASTNKNDQEPPSQLGKHASKPEYYSDPGIVETQPTMSCSASSSPQVIPPSDAASLNSLKMTDKQFSFEKPMEPPSSGDVESEAMSWLNTFAQRKRDILGGSTDTVVTIQAALNIPERAAVDVAFLSANGVENDQSYATPEPRPSVADLYEQLRESLEDVKEIEFGRSESPRVFFDLPHALPPPDHSGPESHAPLPIVDQDSSREDIAQVGYCRSTVGGDTSRYQDQQSQHVNKEIFSWAPSTSAAVSRPTDSFTSPYHGDSNAYASNLRPEVDSMEPAEISAPLLSPTPPVSASVPTTSSMPPKPDIFTLEALKKAGISACVMEAPNVEGLDVKTAEKVQAADATLLRKNYDALLLIVREQQQAKEAAEVRAAEALQDQEEQRAMFEVQIENMKLVNVGLRSKLRALEKRTSLPQVFEQYEQELRMLHAQVQELQTRNVALELRVGGSDRGSVVVATTGASIEFKKKYQQVVEEKLALEREVMEFRKRERHHQVHSRLAGESTRRVDQLSRDLNNKEEDLVATRLSKQRLSAEMNQALEKADQLHHENEKLLQEKAATTEELLVTRMYLASLENEKKASILDLFVEKHGDRMNKLRQQGQSSSSKGENWRRDQYARECEDKLLAAIKRSLPQAVPLCNKLLRRLEIQELSLREFSEREVDFINLLVELVSDQPTVSLKHMIEQEMKKLQT